MNYRLSIGLNYQSYIFEAAIHKGDTVTELVKLSYRFHQREPEIPAKFLDYSILHTFRMTRDQSCDESWSSLSNRYFFDSSGAFRGKTSDLVYSEHASTPKMTDASILPCYVVTPADYRASAKKPLTENARLQIAAK